MEFKTHSSKYRKMRKQIIRDIEEMASKCVFEDTKVIKQEYRKFWRNLKTRKIIEDYKLVWNKSDKNAVSVTVYYRFAKLPEFIQLNVSIEPSGKIE